jgi:hypothetical protein
MKTPHLALVALAFCAAARAADPQPPLTPAERAPTVFAPVWDGLVGRWLGEGDTKDARGVQGAASFAYELDGRVLTRRNVADYPPANGRAGLHHEDLMTIYPAPDGLHAEAMYYDNEGHVIHYAATWASDGRSVVLLSFPEENAPRFRLTWRFIGLDRLATDFDVAAPGSADFKRYAGGVLVRAGH